MAPRIIPLGGGVVSCPTCHDTGRTALQTSASGLEPRGPARAGEAGEECREHPPIIEPLGCAGCGADVELVAFAGPEEGYCGLCCIELLAFVSGRAA